MKALLKLFVFASIIVLIAIGCKKIFSNENAAVADENVFNPAAVKNWYYGSFIKTPEWKATLEKRLPDWKKGTPAMIGKWPTVEYPFIKARSSFSIAGGTLTAAQCKKIADASLSKIVFVKKEDGQVMVREIDYIPDWQYLQDKQFNIGDIKSIGEKTDFTGRIITKNWNGKTLFSRMVVNGKTIKIGKRLANNIIKGNDISSLVTCTSDEYCIWQQDCEITIYGDGTVTDECGPWYNTGECWTEMYCSDDGSGDVDPCSFLACNPPKEDEINCESLSDALQNAVFTENANATPQSSILSQTQTEIERTDYFSLGKFEVPIWASWEFVANNKIIIQVIGGVKTFKDYKFGETSVIGTSTWYSCAANTLASSSRTISADKKTIEGHHWYHFKVSLLFQSCPISQEHDRGVYFSRKIENY